MKVFLTGATGFVGSAVLKELTHAGHDVLALARNPERAEQLQHANAMPIEGTLTTLDNIRSEIAKCDVIVHAGADTRGDVAAADAAALDTMLEIVAKRDLPIIYTSGTLVYGDTGIEAVHESCPLNPLKLVSWRPEQERRVLSAGGTVLRPGWVCGAASGLPGLLVRAGRKEGRVPVLGSGANMISLVHRVDLAILFRLCAERHARGIFNAASTNPVAMRGVSEMISEVLELPLMEVPTEQLLETYRLFGEALLANQAICCDKAANVYGWSPSPVTEDTILK